MAPVKHCPKEPRGGCGGGYFAETKPRWINRGIQGEFYFALRAWGIMLIYYWPLIALMTLLYFVFRK